MRNRAFYSAVLMVIVLMLSPLTGYASEAEKQDIVIRLDDDGYLYYMDYTKDYYSPEVLDAMREIGYIDPGCSVFFTHNVAGECISCRGCESRCPFSVKVADRMVRTADLFGG